MSERVEIYQIPAEFSGQRLDAALAKLVPDYSRARLQELIRAGSVTVDGVARTPRLRLRGGEQVSLRPMHVLPGAGECRPQDLPVEVLFEDEHCLVVNKAVGMLVHPGAGNPDGTLQNALLNRVPELARVPRFGIVHRLDKDTSGCLVVARSELAHRMLTEQMAARTIHREYVAIAHGQLISGGSVDQPLGRHPRDRKKFAVVPGGRPAVTHYRIAARYRRHTALRVTLETGRTHQIRVHMTHLGHPLIGDPLYQGRPRPPADCDPELRDALQRFRRQALHAEQIDFMHPVGGDRIEVSAPQPDDLVALRELLERDATP